MDLENEILLKQEHSEENDIRFIHDVIPILKDPRYIRVNGKPILIVYRLSLLPDPSQTAALWRKICRDEGVGEIYLCAAESFGYSDPYKDGFDAAVQFPPHDVRVLAPANKEIKELPEDYTGVLYDYEEVVFNELNREAPNYKRFRGVMCSWDNTARKKKAGNVFLNATPESLTSCGCAASWTIRGPTFRPESGWFSSMPGMNGLREHIWSQTESLATDF